MVMRSLRVWVALVVASLVASIALGADPTPPLDTAALLKRLDEQEKRIEALEKRLAAQDQKVTATGGAAVSTLESNPAGPANVNPASGTAAIPVASARAGSQGFAIQSPDGANVLRFRGNIAFDGHWYSDHSTPETADTWLFRRIRPYFEGTIDDIYDFRIMPDFAQGKTAIVDGFIGGRFAQWFVVQAGKFKGPVGLERLQPDQWNRFIELGMTSDLVPNRDMGVQVSGDVFHGALGYALGYFTGVTDGASTDAASTPDLDNDGKKDWEGRLFAQPFLRSGNPYLSGLGFGIAGTYVNVVTNPGNPILPSYRTPGQQIFFSYRTGATATYADGQRDRWSPQLFYYVGRFGLIGEYVESSQDVARQATAALKRTGRMNNSAWQASLSYFLTGERESYNLFAPHSTFELGKPGWGAWEIVARVHEVSVDEAAFADGAASFADPTTSARSARAVGVGLNWYLNRNFKWMVDYERTRFELGASGGNRADENAIFTRFQLAY
jgi:phosphate-selective porin OprO/OprP